MCGGIHYGEVEGLVSVERWSYSRGALCVVECTMGDRAMYLFLWVFIWNDTDNVLRLKCQFILIYTTVWMDSPHLNSTRQQRVARHLTDWKRGSLVHVQPQISLTYHTQTTLPCTLPHTQRFPSNMIAIFQDEVNLGRPSFTICSHCHLSPISTVGLNSPRKYLCTLQMSSLSCYWGI